MRGSSGKDKKNKRNDQQGEAYKLLNEVQAEAKAGNITSNSDYEKLLVDVVNKYQELLADKDQDLITESLFKKKVLVLENILLTVKFHRDAALDHLKDSLETLSLSIQAGRKNLNQIPSSAAERASLSREIDRAIKSLDNDRVSLRKKQIDLDNRQLSKSRSEIEAEYTAKIDQSTQVIDWLKEQKDFLKQHPSENYLRIKKIIEAGKPTIIKTALQEMAANEALERRVLIGSNDRSALRRGSIFEDKGKGKEKEKKQKPPVESIVKRKI
jgi:hypothetical protein